MYFLDKSVFFLIFLSVMSTTLEFSLAVKYGREESVRPVDNELVDDGNVAVDEDEDSGDKDLYDDYGIDEEYDDFEDDDYDEDGEDDDYDYEEENIRNWMCQDNLQYNSIFKVVKHRVLIRISTDICNLIYFKQLYVSNNLETISY